VTNPNTQGSGARGTKIVEEKINAYKIFGRRPEEKTLVGRFKHG
jgi:hypothetical protein